MSILRKGLHESFPERLETGARLLERAGTGAVQVARQAVPVAQLGVRRMLGRKQPFSVTLSLTNRCNFRCEYCDIPLQDRDEMSTGQWLQCIDELRSGGMVRCSLIGGEPLLIPDIGIIIQHLKKRGVHVAMNTNAWMIEKRLDVVRDLDLVCITLDGPEEVHDRQRKKGSYERVIRALELLRREDIPVVTMAVMTPDTADNITHVLDVADRYGFKAYFQLEHDATADVMKPIAERMSDERIADVARHLIDLKRAGRPIGNSLPILEMFIRDGRRIGGDCSGCYAGTYFAYVLSDGTVAPCLLTQRQVPVANGIERGFLQAFYDLAEPKGPGCSCVPYHEVNRMLSMDARVIFGALENVLA